jgi:hypothetical protein
MSAATAWSGEERIGRVQAGLPEAWQWRLKSARQLAREVEEAHGAPFATAVPAVDRLLAGGLPRGQLVELIGPRSSGRFSTLLALLAAATGVGEAAALVDLGDGLDPEAAQAAGVDLSRLLWARPTTSKEALAAAELLLGSGFPLVVVDLGVAPVRGGGGAEASWLRLARAARAQGAALLVGAPYRVSGTAAGAVLKLNGRRPAWLGAETGAPPLLAGCSVRFVLEKHRGHSVGQSAGLELTVPGVPRAAAPRPARRAQQQPPAPVAVEAPAAAPAARIRLRAAAG